MKKHFLIASALTLILSCSAIASNLIENGNCESLQGWNIDKPEFVSLSDQSVEGKHSIKLGGDTSAPDGSEPILAWQKLDIKKFDLKGDYRLKFRAKSDHFPQVFNLSMGVEKDGIWISSITWKRRQVGTSWQDVQVDFRDFLPTADGFKLCIQVRAPGSVWIDDLRIEQLPAGTIWAEERKLKDLPKYKGSPSYVQITSDRRFLVKGKPFFPIGMWGIDFPNEKAMRDMRDFGFNTCGSGHLYTKGVDGTKSYLDMAHSYGLMVNGVLRFGWEGENAEALAEAEKMKEIFKPIMEVTKIHPALLAYDLADEAAAIGTNLAAFAEGANFLRANDPNHPIFSNQAARGSVDLLKRWYRFEDIGGSDIYPWRCPAVDNFCDLPNRTISVVGEDCAKNLKALGPGKPALMTIQAFAWNDVNGVEPKSEEYSYPPTEILRFMCYDAITSGASGVMLYQCMAYKDEEGQIINPKVKPVSLDLSAMHDVLASPTIRKGAKPLDKRIKLITKKYGKDLYIIAVNTTGENVNSGIALPSSSKTWTVLFEGRTVNATKKAFQESFGPWDVSIYTNCKDPKLLEQFENKAMGIR